MGHTKTYNSNHSLIVALVLVSLPFLAPTSITNGYFGLNFETLVRAWKLAAMLAICIAAVRWNYRIGMTFLCLSAMFVVCVLSTYMHDGATSQQVNLAVSWVLFFVVCDLGINRKPKESITAFAYVLVAMVLVNAVTVLLSPEALFLSETGMKNWFLGDRNVFISYCIPAVALCCVRDIQSDKRLSKLSVVCWASCIVQITLVWSATSVFVFGLLFILMIIYLAFRKMPGRLNIKTYAVLVLLVFICIVLFRMQDYLALIIQGLGKDLSFTGRTQIWTDAMQVIADAPFFGQGAQERITYLPVWNGEFNVSHAHNIYLQVMCVGGLTAFLLFAVALVLAGRSLNVCDPRIAYCLSACCGMLLLAGCFDYYQTLSLCLLIVLALRSGTLLGSSEQ